MTITDARRLQVRHFGKATLLDICAAAHSIQHNHADTEYQLTQRFCQQIKEVLQARLATWKPGRVKDERFDSAVKALCEATLAELENRR